MLAPLWDLPVASRGVIELTTYECEAIFISDNQTLVDEVVSARVDRMTAPFFGNKRPRGNDLEGELFA